MSKIATTSKKDQPTLAEAFRELAEKKGLGVAEGKTIVENMAEERLASRARGGARPPRRSRNRPR